MKHLYQIALCSLMLGFGTAAVAEKVYEKVGPDGVREFSDEASAGASEVDIEPNVIDVNPVNAPPPPPAASQARPPAASGQESVELVGERDNVYQDGDEWRAAEGPGGREFDATSPPRTEAERREFDPTNPPETAAEREEFNPTNPPETEADREEFDADNNPGRALRGGGVR